MPQVYCTVSVTWSRALVLTVNIACRWRYMSVGSFDDRNTVAQPFGDDVNTFAFAD
jgi:hypothetical protein